MARDVRVLRAASSGTETTRPASSLSMPMAQPASTAPIPEKEVPKKEENEAKSEVERAKVEAQTAKASEALAQRKLADAEAALKKAKEEAQRASVGSGRAKAEAQNAREAEAAVEQSWPLPKRLERRPNKPVTAAIRRDRVLEGDCVGGWEEHQTLKAIRHLCTTSDASSRFAYCGLRGVASIGERWRRAAPRTKVSEAAGLFPSRQSAACARVRCPKQCLAVRPGTRRRRRCRHGRGLMPKPSRSRGQRAVDRQRGQHGQSAGVLSRSLSRPTCGRDWERRSRRHGLVDNGPSGRRSGR